MRPLGQILFLLSRSTTRGGQQILDVATFNLNKRLIHSGQMMTTQEVATALRPFIFIIHPDRFWNHPKEKITNEVSLKKLNEFLGDRLSHRMASNEEIITFYMRNNEKGAQNPTSHTEVQMKKINIRLSSRENLNTTVHHILSECSLSTDYLKKIGKQPRVGNKASSSDSREIHGFYRRGNDYFYSKDLFDEFENEIAHDFKVNELNLTDWLKENYLISLQKLKASQPIHIEVVRLKDELIQELQLVDLQWNCDWSVSHIRGCLNNLSVLSKHYPHDLQRLRGKTIIFSRQNGIGHHGQVILNIEDVRHGWLDLIRFVKKQDPYVMSLPVAEKRLSDLLRGIAITHSTHNNVLIAKRYVKQLERFTRTINEYMATNELPDQWPASLAEYKLIVESDSGPLMLSTAGYFIVPASCPASLFVRFITENANKARQILLKEKQELSQEKHIIEKCIVTFGLKALDKDTNITPEQMIAFGQKLLQEKDHFRPYLKGLQVRVSMYYSLLNDGHICVPFNFLPH